MSSTLIAPLVSVIVPTMASLERADLLKRAIFSIRASSVHPIRIIVVVNGNRHDQGVCDWLKAQSDIEFIYESTPSLSGALLKGRQAVDTEFFSTLDDDDEYLPVITDKKLEALSTSDGADLLVGNVFECTDGIDTLRFEDLINVPMTPLPSLMRFSWLLSGNAIYRSASVEASYFSDPHPFAEWTWLAFRLAMDGKKIAILDVPTFRYHQTADSLSKSEQFFKSYIPLFERMLARKPTGDVRRMILRKMGDAYHDASVAALKKGRRFDAWQLHFHSLVRDGGLRYLSYTRHLLK